MGAHAWLGPPSPLRRWRPSGTWRGASPPPARHWHASRSLPSLPPRRARYRSIAHLASRVDHALHEGRTVSVADMREGELAILASEVDKALTQLTLSAEAMEREKNALADSLADISHQLRTPLTSMGITLELMRREAHASGDEAGLAHVRTSAQLLSQVQWLVSALLKLARLDAGAIKMHHERVDVARLVQDAFSPLEIAYELADVELTTSVPAGAAFEGDDAWTREALENVLKNCMEHTPAGGRVAVVVLNDALTCRIVVEDTGPGIAEDDLPHVFERFWRADAAEENAVNPAGVGIGLSLAKALVEAQGGRISAGNARGDTDGVHGARFEITFFKMVV